MLNVFGNFFLAFSFLFFAIHANAAPSAKAQEKILVYPKVCHHGLVQGPKNNFAVFVFCDDAAGTSIGIINTTPSAYVGPGSEKVWRVEQRFWQDPQWARDVQYFKWSEDGLMLTVSTSSIYGSGKTYTLDLAQKKIKEEKDASTLADFSHNKEKFSPKNLPKFESYSTKDIYKSTNASLKINSYPEAGKYRTRLGEGLKEGANFAGHYVVIPIGCGTNCQNQWIVDAKTGKVIARFLTTLNAEYRLNSNLLILNPPTDELKQLYKENPQTAYLTGKTAYVVLEKNTPKIIYEEELTKLLSAESNP